MPGRRGVSLVPRDEMVHARPPLVRLEEAKHIEVG